MAKVTRAKAVTPMKKRAKKKYKVTTTKKDPANKEGLGKLGPEAKKIVAKSKQRDAKAKAKAAKKVKSKADKVAKAKARAKASKDKS